MKTKRWLVTLRVMKRMSLLAANEKEAVEFAENNEGRADLVSIHVEDLVELDSNGRPIE